MKKRLKKIIILSSLLILLLLVLIDKEPDLIIANTTYALTIDDAESTTLPTSGNYYLTSYTCKNGSTITWNKESHELSIKNINKKEEHCNLTFESKPSLSKMKVGDYVEYVGDKNNGCLEGKAGTTGNGVAEAGNSCKGENANQSLDNSNYTYGYCYDPDYKFYVYGWRIAYIEGDNVHLTSAGSPECLSPFISYEYPVELVDLNTAALKYCNSNYVDGTCSSSNTWAMGNNDFQKITKYNLTSTSGTPDCANASYAKKCGYNNDLIDNGGYYLFSEQYIQDSEYITATGYTPIWDPSGRYVTTMTGKPTYGLRPVIKLSKEVYVTGGSGTMDDPYKISK